MTKLEEVMGMSMEEQLEYFASGQHMADMHMDLVQVTRTGLFEGVCERLEVTTTHPEYPRLQQCYNDFLDVAVRKFDLDVTLVGQDEWTTATLASFNDAFVDRVSC